MRMHQLYDSTTLLDETSIQLSRHVASDWFDERITINSHLLLLRRGEDYMSIHLCRIVT